MGEDAKAYRVSDFCRCYAISKAGFYREIAAKRLCIIKRGHTTLVTLSEAERWFENLCQNQSQKSV